MCVSLCISTSMCGGCVQNKKADLEVWRPGRQKCSKSLRLSRSNKGSGKVRLKLKVLALAHLPNGGDIL